ncbi:MAG: hypothetical protein HYV02_08165 [Deltaproteobacteria bacterium]|nr:hypothetical protein [Deltaproteobacteria bacterium]
MPKVTYRETLSTGQQLTPPPIAEVRDRIRQILAPFYPSAKIEELVANREIVEIFRGLLAITTPEDILNLRIEDANGKLVVHATLRSAVTQCISRPDSRERAGEMKCTTSHYTAAERQLTLEQVKTGHHSPKAPRKKTPSPPPASEMSPPRESATAPDRQHREEASTPRPLDVIVRPLLPENTEAMYRAAVRAEAERMATPSVQIATIDFERKCVTIRRSGVLMRNAHGEPACLPRDDLFNLQSDLPPGGKARRFWTNEPVDGLEQMTLNQRVVLEESCVGGKCDYPDTPTSLPCPLENYYQRFPNNKREAEQEWLANVRFILTLHPERLRWYVWHFNPYERVLFNAMRIAGGEAPIHE